MSKEENEDVGAAVERSTALAEEGDAEQQQTPEGQRMRPQLKKEGRLSVRSMNFGIPTNEGAQEHVHEIHGKDSWRYAVVSFLHSKPVQITLMTLLLLDVVILFTEIFLLATYPNCSTIVRDAISCCPVVGAEGERFLSETHGEGYCEEGEPSEYDAGCDEHKWHKVHKAEEALFISTVIILSIFVVEQNLAMAALTPCIYFRQLFYLLDYFIVAVSLALEVTFRALDDDTVQSLVGLIVLARIWRFVRIGHGLVEVTSELSHKKYEALLGYTEQLERLLDANGIEPPDSESIRQLKATSISIIAEIQKEHREKHYHHISSGASNVAPDKSAGKATSQEADRRS